MRQPTRKCVVSSLSRRVGLTDVAVDIDDIYGKFRELELMTRKKTFSFVQAVVEDFLVNCLVLKEYFVITLDECYWYRMAFL